MKCYSCGKKIVDEDYILCMGCRSVDFHVAYLRHHVCGSFRQTEGEIEGACANYLMCTPIKSALKHEPLILAGQGLVVCPHPGINLSRIIHVEVNREDAKRNFPECFE